MKTKKKILKIVSRILDPDPGVKKHRIPDPQYQYRYIKNNIDFGLGSGFDWSNKLGARQSQAM